MSDDRKTRQLCAQVQRVTSQFLGYEANDELLQSLFVEAVDPAPDATCVQVTLSVPRDLDVDRADVLRRLHAVTGALRAEIARSVKRRKAPGLNFLVVRAPE